MILTPSSKATSGLDAESEHLVQKALDDSTHGRTVLMISHRLKTAQSADKILVLHKGSIVEEGTHSELMANPEGVYASLVRRQALKT